MRIRPCAYSLFFFFLLTLLPAIAQAVNVDSINPEIITDPKDTTISCPLDLMTELQHWYDTRAGMQGADNSDTFTLEAVQSYQEVLDSLVASQDTICYPNSTLIVDYYVLDTCGNSSDTIAARFSYFDNQSPIITNVASSVDYECTEGIADSLFNWLVSKGGATATDACSDSVIWPNYFWNDNQGNSGFVLAGDEANIVVQRQSCIWEITVSFFVTDPCGNSNVTNAVFRVIGDFEEPIINYQPVDTTISCTSTSYFDEPIINDICDGELTLEFDETDTKSTDENSCGFYNYEITRTWIATDICGNSTSVEQTISVTDTVAPQATLEDFVLVDCNDNINSDFDDFISISDNCSNVAISFQDVQGSFFSCQEQLERTWILTDACGNSSTYEQTIQIQDLTGPYIDTIAINNTLYCTDVTEISAAFEMWLADAGGSKGNDICSDFEIFPLLPGSYSITDPSSILFAPSATLDRSNCNPLGDRIINQEVDFVYLDTCDNASFVSAFFQVFDTIAPVITSCNEDITFRVLGNVCDTMVELSVPEAQDGCDLFDSNFLSYALIIDNGFRRDFNGVDPELVSFGVGEHTVEYLVFDCANNVSSCVQKIIVNDDIPPQITCPEDVSFVLPVGQCEMEVLIPQNYSVIENCKNGILYDETQPAGAGYLSFSFREELDTFGVNSVFLNFSNTEIIGDVIDPKLEILFAGDTDAADEYFILLSELGTVIGNYDLDGSQCDQFSSFTIEFDEAEFKNWAADGEVSFTLTPNESNTDGINPCVELEESGIDSSTVLKANLSYSDVFPVLELKDSFGLIIPVNDPFQALSLSSGTYTTQYGIVDASGNLDSCSFEVFIIDEEAPVISCEGNDSILIVPSTASSFSLTAVDFEFSVTDNCDVDTVMLSPSVIDCASLENFLNVEATALDHSGNSSVCNFEVVVESIQLEPTFLSGLCVNDTLQLLANNAVADPNGVFSYQWTGPNNFMSNDENPIVLNINTDVQGVYELQLTDGLGCVFNGSVEIEINALDAPIINSASTNICEGERLLLNSNSFTETVDYLWYEGVSPNGVLIDITTGPSLQIEPTVGTHFYYVDIEGENCNTNASTTLEITVSEQPVAQVNEPFITVCEGEEISFSSPSTDPDFRYVWSGPAAYLSSGQFPESIAQAELQNQGFYSLVIEKDGCFSDTATVQVVVFPQPTKPVISGDNLYCEGSNFILSVDNIPSAQQYLWFKDGALYNNQSSNNLVIPAAQNILSGDWSVIVQDGFCFSDTSEIFSVTVNPMLNIGVTNNGPICQGDSVILSSSFIPDAQYNWSSPSGLNYDGRNLIVPAEEGIYALTVTTTSNCSSVATTEVVLTSVPSITALSNSSTPCIDAQNSIVFVPSVFPPGVYSYQWSGPNGFSSTLESPTLNNATTLANGVYTLIISNGNCESEPATTNVDISVIPEPPSINLLSSTCEGDRLVIQETSGQIYDSYNWTTPKGLFSNSLSELIIDPLTQSDQGFYELTVTRNGCQSLVSNRIEIEILEKPSTPKVTGVNKLCVGETLTLNTDNISGAVYTWTGPNGNLSSQNSILEIQDISSSDAGSYFVQITEEGCSSEISSEFVVEVSMIPVTPNFVDTEIALCIDLTNPLEICLTDPATLDSEFLLYDFDNDDLIATTTDSCFILDMIDTNWETLVVRKSSNGCFSENSNPLILSIDNIPNEAASFEADRFFICDEEQLVLNSVNGDDLDLNWFASDSMVLIEENGAAATISSISENTIIYLASSKGECKDFGLDSTVIITQNILEANDDFFELEYNGNESFDFFANDILTDVFVNFSDNEDLDFSFDGILLSVESNSNFIGNTQIEYTICNKDCPDICTSAIITIKVGDNEDCFVGNVITPNNDGINDFLEVPCLNSGIYPENELFIFNQWGDEIYNASPYENNWDGTFKSQPLSVGTYYYVLKLGPGIKELEGFIILER